MRGPVPWWWLAKAGRLPGHTLHVAVVLWLLRGINSKSEFKVEHKFISEMGVSRQALYRALEALEGAGLIFYKTARGKSTTVWLNNPKPPTKTTDVSV
ncbi:MAG: hypothetical protein ACXWRU_12115 [Pseudobdellovibrionaceae bacterium]